MAVKETHHQLVIPCTVLFGLYISVATRATFVPQMFVAHELKSAAFVTSIDPPPWCIVRRRIGGTANKLCDERGVLVHRTERSVLLLMKQNLARC